MTNLHQIKLSNLQKKQQAPSCIICEHPIELLRVQREKPQKRGQKGRPVVFEWRCPNCEHFQKQNSHSSKEFLQTFVLMR